MKKMFSAPNVELIMVEEDIICSSSCTNESSCPNEDLCDD